MNQPALESPIQNLTNFDILGVRVDGGIDAVIVAATPIDGSVVTLTSLTTKVRNYITELASSSFLAQHPDASGKTRIVIMAHCAIDGAAQGLIQSLAKEAAAASIALEIEHVVA